MTVEEVKQLAVGDTVTRVALGGVTVSGTVVFVGQMGIIVKGPSTEIFHHYSDRPQFTTWKKIVPWKPFIGEIERPIGWGNVTLKQGHGLFKLGSTALWYWFEEPDLIALSELITDCIEHQKGRPK